MKGATTVNFGLNIWLLQPCLEVYNYLIIVNLKIMEGRPFNRLYKAALVSDSRGKLMENSFNSITDFPVQFSVYYRNGAKLEHLWETIEQILLFEHVDIIYILGGVCNITDVTSYNGLRQFWPPPNLTSRVNALSSIMSDIFGNYSLMYTNTKLCMLPEPGLDLIRYNRIANPVDYRLLLIQHELEDKLHFLQELTRSLNATVNMRTPWTLDITHARRHGRIVPVYDRLSDGLHFSTHIRKKYARMLSKHAFMSCAIRN